MSHPVVSGKKPFTAFRGSMQIEQQNSLKEIHVGLRSGESLALTDINLLQGQDSPVKVTLVYPADATPGHLLSVVPVNQLALLHQRQRQQRTAQQNRTITKTEVVVPKSPPPPPELQQKVPPKPVPSLQPAIMAPRPSSPSTNDPRYTDAIRSQQQWLRQLQGR